jgi:hypothetical protein
MKAIGILLILAGIAGFVLSGVAFGDIGLSFAFGSVVALLSGIGFLVTSKKV